MLIQIHDFIWLQRKDQLYSTDPLPDWLNEQWSVALPAVIRRSPPLNQLIPVGIRGVERHQRFAAWVDKSHIIRSCRPDEVCLLLPCLSERMLSHPTLVGLQQLLEQHLHPVWGITGSVAYTMVAYTLGRNNLEMPYNAIHDNSDLDIVFRCPVPLPKQNFDLWIEAVKTLPCRADLRIETPVGGFSLMEWHERDEILLKTAQGPLIVTDPWQSINR